MIDWSAALTRAFTEHLEIGGRSGASGSPAKFYSNSNRIGSKHAPTTSPDAVVGVVHLGRTTATTEVITLVQGEGSQEPQQNLCVGERCTTATTGTTDFRAACVEPDEQSIIRWLDDHPAPSRAGRCAWCGNVETENSVVPFGTVPGTHAWLHVECWPAWQASRRAQARHALLSEVGEQNP